MVRSHLGNCERSAAIVLTADDIKRLLMIFGNTSWGGESTQFGPLPLNFIQDVVQTASSRAPKYVFFVFLGECKTSWARTSNLMALHLKADVGFLGSFRSLSSQFVTVARLRGPRRQFSVWTSTRSHFTPEQEFIHHVCCLTVNEFLQP